MRSGRLIKAAIGGLALLAVPAPPALAEAETPAASDFGVAPWSEVIVSVTDLDESSSWLIEDGGWRVVSEGPVHASELRYWKLGNHITAQFRKICAAEAETGCIRFVRFDGVEDQRPIRQTARPWDTGGIFSIMLRSQDTEALYDAAIARGWWAESEPYRFSFGGSDLVNVVIRGPHGVNYALYEREAPPFTAFPIGRLSQAFNTMRMVKDQPASLAFYRDTLGLRVLFDAPFTDPEPRSNNFSVPANLATTLVRRAAVVQPALPGETGRIEVMQFEGFEGRDLSEHASPPNLGVISVRYPVRDLKGYHAAIEERRVEVAYEARNVPIEGIGTANLFAVRSPDGALTEFYHAR